MYGMQLDVDSSLGGGSEVKGRKASKSVSSVRPGSLNLGQRTTSYHSPSASASATMEPVTAPMPSLLTSTDAKNPRLGLKRRISTPSIMMQREKDEGAVEKKEEVQQRKQVESRARSTSTSISVPPMNALAGPSNYQSSPSQYRSELPAIPSIPTINHPAPAAPWTPIFVIPASPDDGVSGSQQAFPYQPARPRHSDRSSGILNSAYELGESGLTRLAKWIRPSSHLQRRGSDDDSEKGMDDSEDVSADSGGSVARTSEDSIRRNGKYWGVWGNGDGENDEEGYFSLPPTPPEEKSEPSLAQFEAALRDGRLGANAGGSLPTPALSTRSLSRSGSKRRRRVVVGEESNGWLATVVHLWSNLGSGSGSRSGGKTAEVLKELGWTVAFLVVLFVVTLAIVAWLIQGMPM